MNTLVLRPQDPDVYMELQQMKFVALQVTVCRVVIISAPTRQRPLPIPGLVATDTGYCDSANREFANSLCRVNLYT